MRNQPHFFKGAFMGNKFSIPDDNMLSLKKGAFSSCLSYKVLDTDLACARELSNENNGKRAKIMLFIDVGYFLDKMTMSLDVKDRVEDDERYQYNAAITLLNVAAHYRHYYYTKLHSINSIVMFCPDKNKYDEYEGVLKVLDTLSSLIRKLIYVPKVGDVTRFFYTHIAELIYITSKLNSQMDVIPHIISDSVALYQLAAYSDDISIFRDPYGTFKPKIANKNEILNRFVMRGFGGFYDARTSDQVFLNKMITPLMAIFGMGIKGFSCIKFISRMSKKKRFERLKSFLKTDGKLTERDYTRNFGLHLLEGANKEDLELFHDRLNILDYKNDLFAKETLANLSRNWTSKMYIENLQSYNDMIDNDENMLKIEWLSET